MPGAENNQLTPYLKKEAGEYLRGVVSYEGDEYEIRYIRDDLRTRRLKSEIDTMIDRLRRESRPGERRTFPFGELNGIVRSFEEVISWPDSNRHCFAISRFGGSLTSPEWPVWLGSN